MAILEPTNLLLQAAEDLALGDHHFPPTARARGGWRHSL